MSITPERIFGDPSLQGQTAGSLRLSPDGDRVAFAMQSSDGRSGTRLHVADMRGGRVDALLDLGTLDVRTAEPLQDEFRAQQRMHLAAATPLSYFWERAGQSILLVNGRDLYRVHVDGGHVERLSNDGTVGLDPQLAPGSRHLSFVRDRRLVIREIASGAEQLIADDAGDPVSYGTSEFVAQEELRRFTGAWWSCDGRSLAYTRVDESLVPPLARLVAGRSGSEIVQDRYPLTGANNADVRLFVRDVHGGTTHEIDLEFAQTAYLADLHWFPGSASLLVERLSRDHRRLELLKVDVASATITTLVTETSDTWIDLEHDVRVLGDGSFLRGSARTGWRHLDYHAADGRLVRQVTRGDWRLSPPGSTSGPGTGAIVGVDEEAGVVYIAASLDTPLERHLYRVPYQTSGEPERLTARAGWWGPILMADQPQGFVATHSDPATPSQTGIYSLDGTRLGWVAENRVDERHPLTPYLAQRPIYRFDTIRSVSGDALHYMLAVPADFDERRRYPVIVRVYGGPAPQLVRRAWPPLSDLYWTQQGYLVFTLDNRGSGNRSRAFEHVFQDDLGGASAEDQLTGLAFLRSLPFIAGDRIAMTGWSFGGYTTMRLMSDPRSGLRAGVAGGVPAAFALYDTAYTERYLGRPQHNVAAYARSDLLPRLKDLDGELLLMHGMIDDNVLLVNYLALLDELQRQGKVFETMLYPGEGHVVSSTAALTHIMKTQARFLDRHLKNGSDAPEALLGQSQDADAPDRRSRRTAGLS